MRLLSSNKYKIIRLIRTKSLSCISVRRGSFPKQGKLNSSSEINDMTSTRRCRRL